ncbi:MAG: hypothetical protein AAFV88_23715 [Planctomycetota bacterium]
MLRYPSWRAAIGSIIAATSLTFIGCSANSNVEVIDLNRVLDVLVETLDAQAEAEKKDGEPAAAGADSVATVQAGGDTATETVAIKTQEPDPERDQAFVKDFATRLNAAKLITTPIGVKLAENGSLVGFKDANKDLQQGTGEALLFTVEIDAEGGRLIASDTDGHYRPHGYRGGGFLTGYFIGRMMGGQNRYYSGSRAAMRPNYRNTTMSPKNYHASAVSKARTRAASSRFSSSSSSRSRSGSGSFGFGK